VKLEKESRILTWRKGEGCENIGKEKEIEMERMRGKKIKKNKKGREMTTKKNEEQNAETVARRMGAT